MQFREQIRVRPVNAKQISYLQHVSVPDRWRQGWGRGASIAKSGRSTVRRRAWARSNLSGPVRQVLGRGRAVGIGIPDRMQRCRARIGRWGQPKLLAAGRMLQDTGLSPAGIDI